MNVVPQMKSGPAAAFAETVAIGKDTLYGSCPGTGGGGIEPEPLRVKARVSSSAAVSRSLIRNTPGM